MTGSFIEPVALMVTKDEILSAIFSVKDLALVRKVIGLIEIKTSQSSPLMKGGAFFEIPDGGEKGALILFPNSTVDHAVRAFAKALVYYMDAEKKKRVKWFMTTTNPDWISLLKLNWPDHASFPTYKSLVDHHTTPVAKLCTMITCNAFKANHVPRADSYGVDLESSPYVGDFVTGRRYYPLYALVSAYAPQFIDNFPEFFVDGCSGFGSVLHTEMQKELSIFLESVLD